MDVSLWWVIAASILGVWTGFALFAALTMAKGSEDDEQSLAPRTHARPLAYF